MSLANRIGTWFAYAWCAVLVVQNATVAVTAIQIRTPEADGYLWWALIKAVVLCTAVLAFVRRRSRVNLIVLAATIVLAFPLSVIAEQMLAGHAAPTVLLLTTSALLSYAATAALLAANRRLLAGA